MVRESTGSCLTQAPSALGRDGPGMKPDARDPPHRRDLCLGAMSAVTRPLLRRVLQFGKQRFGVGLLGERLRIFNDLLQECPSCLSLVVGHKGARQMVA